MFESEQNADHPKASSLMGGLFSFGKSTDDAQDAVASRLAALAEGLAARLPSRGYIKH